jgi:DNA-3-methyladenine glycosylase
MTQTTDEFTPLSADFFRQDALTVARALVGTRLVREMPSSDGRLVGRVVETEAYTQDDPAFHGWGLYDEETDQLKREGRGYELFGAPGTGYVYLCYGIHWLLNVVTDPEGTGGAALIRAVEPLQGEDAMRERRGQTGAALTNGPGKLTDAFGVDDAFHGAMLTGPPLFFARPEAKPDLDIATSSRIGITKATERPWRFLLEGNRYVSRGTPSDQKDR